jgi:hypothetical protein
MKKSEGVPEEEAGGFALKIAPPVHERADVVQKVIRRTT